MNWYVVFFTGFDLTEKFLLRKGTIMEDLPSFRLGSSPLIKPTMWVADNIGGLYVRVHVNLFSESLFNRFLHCWRTTHRDSPHIDDNAVNNLSVRHSTCTSLLLLWWNQSTIQASCKVQSVVCGQGNVQCGCNVQAITLCLPEKALNLSDVVEVIYFHIQYLISDWKHNCFVMHL